MSKTTSWPVVVDKVVCDTDGHYQFLHTKEGIGPQLLTIFPFPVKWRGYAQWSTIEHLHFVEAVRPGTEILMDLDARWHLIKITDNYHEFVIYDEYHDDIFIPDQKLPRKGSFSTSGGGGKGLKKTTVNLPRQPVVISSSPKSPRLNPSKPKALTFSFTLTSGTSEYKHVLCMKKPLALLTREYLLKLSVAIATEDPDTEIDLMLEAMMKEFDMNIY